MKKITIIVLFFAVYSLAAECDFDVHGQFEIYFTDSSLWWHDSKSFFGVGPILINGELSYVLEDGYNCEKERDEKAFLDTNVFIHRAKSRFRGVDDVNYIDLFSLTTAKHSIGEVFRDEFLHWQQCGMLNLTYEEADSLITPLAKDLDRNLSDDSGFGHAYDSGKFYATDYPVGQFPRQFVLWRDKTCKTNVPVLSRSISDEKIIVENGLVRIPNSLQGKKYFVFDLNGKLIQKGTAGKILRIQSSPVILKIENHKSALVKY